MTFIFYWCLGAEIWTISYREFPLWWPIENGGCQYRSLCIVLRVHIFLKSPDLLRNGRNSFFYSFNTPMDYYPLPITWQVFSSQDTIKRSISGLLVIILLLPHYSSVMEHSTSYIMSASTNIIQMFWHERVAFQRSAVGRSTAGNDVLATIIISLFLFLFFPPFFFPFLLCRDLFS